METDAQIGCIDQFVFDSCKLFVYICLNTARDFLGTATLLFHVVEDTPTWAYVVSPGWKNDAILTGIDFEVTTIFQNVSQ